MVALYLITSVSFMKIPIRMLQRQTKEFTDLLAKNKGTVVDVVDRNGIYLFGAVLDCPKGDFGGVQPVGVGGVGKVTDVHIGVVPPYRDGVVVKYLVCDTCKIAYKDIRAYLGGKICTICHNRTKAKGSFYMLEKL